MLDAKLVGQTGLEQSIAMNIHGDTLEYARMLENAGMERPHAEAVAKLQAQTVKDLIDHELVTRDHLKSELESQELKLRDEIRGETAKLRDEIRDLKDDFRRELNNESTALRRHIDGVTIQIRALRVGGAIAAFAISAVVLLSRLIR